eukprot:NODE_40_length_2133_cov_444.187438_g39_i0.p1 GENE.NODE_40_length_2133_cov_444.187438_g39_i0~~NODE_40_length_2133_cov_444.187438_g39_i0.p1  ORF type:complete len:631 (-),score=117.68 NODE_40_length_2133_cov_444.187438_g39_i0:151-2043(-)
MQTVTEDTFTTLTFVSNVVHVKPSCPPETPLVVIAHSVPVGGTVFVSTSVNGVAFASRNVDNNGFAKLVLPGGLQQFFAGVETNDHTFSECFIGVVTSSSPPALTDAGTHRSGTSLTSMTRQSSTLTRHNNSFYRTLVQYPALLVPLHQELEHLRNIKEDMGWIMTGPEDTYETELTQDEVQNHISDDISTHVAECVNAQQSLTELFTATQELTESGGHKKYTPMIANAITDFRSSLQQLKEAYARTEFCYSHDYSIINTCKDMAHALQQAVDLGHQKSDKMTLQKLFTSHDRIIQTLDKKAVGLRKSIQQHEEKLEYNELYSVTAELLQNRFQACNAYAAQQQSARPYFEKIDCMKKWVQNKENMLSVVENLKAQSDEFAGTCTADLQRIERHCVNIIEENESWCEKVRAFAEQQILQQKKKLRQHIRDVEQHKSSLQSGIISCNKFTTLYTQLHRLLGIVEPFLSELCNTYEKELRGYAKGHNGCYLSVYREAVLMKGRTVVAKRTQLSNVGKKLRELQLELEVQKENLSLSAKEVHQSVLDCEQQHKQLKEEVAMHQADLDSITQEFSEVAVCFTPEELKDDPLEELAKKAQERVLREINLQKENLEIQQKEFQQIIPSLAWKGASI